MPVMSRETKFGLLLVVALTSAFGALVYKRLHQPADLAAGTEVPGDVPAGDGATGDEPPAAPATASIQDAAWGETAPAARPAPVRPVSTTSAVVDSLTAGNAEPQAPGKSRLPANLTDEEFFSPPATTTARSTVTAPPAEPQTEPDPFAADKAPAQGEPTAAVEAQQADPFAAPAGAGTAVALAAPRSAPDLASPSPAADPFAGTANSAAAPAAEPVLSPPIQSAATVTVAQAEEPDPFANDPFPTPTPQIKSEPARSAAPGRPAPTTDERFGDYRPGRVGSASTQATTVIERPKNLPTDLDFDARPSPPPLQSPADAPARTAAAAFTGGTVYVLEPNDNFWTISKKVYGTGRYFQALARHNAAAFPDPRRMRPGQQVSVPPAAELESLYPGLVAPAASPAVAALQRRPDRYQPQEEPGFFVGDSGQPMYRVGSEDTLSSISRQHLGRSSRWVQILEMNRDVLKDGNALSVGTVLRLPADASAVQVVGFERERR